MSAPIPPQTPSPDSPQAEAVAIVDAALERFGTRDLVSGSEVLDFLLDLRLALLGAPDALEQLLELENAGQPTG